MIEVYGVVPYCECLDKLGVGGDIGLALRASCFERDLRVPLSCDRLHIFGIAERVPDLKSLVVV